MRTIFGVCFSKSFYYLCLHDIFVRIESVDTKHVMAILNSIALLCKGFKFGGLPCGVQGITFFIWLQDSDLPPNLVTQSVVMPAYISKEKIFSRFDF